MSWKLLAPWYWPTWFALGVLRCCVLLPMPVLRVLGQGAGALAYYLPTRFRRVARRNINLCFPELGAAERHRILREHFASLGLTLFETGLAWWASDARIVKLTDVAGLEHLDAALAKGKGAILLSAHFTTLDIAGRALTARHIPFNLMYRPTKNPVIEYCMARFRTNHARRSITHDEVRALVAALKANEAVWYAPDQAYRNKGAQMVPFFNVPCASNTATSRIAKLTGAPVLPYVHERIAGGRYRMQLLPPLKDFPSDDPVADTQRFHAVIEAHVRRLPAHYFWVHRRFKGLSADYPDYYARKPAQQGNL